MTNSFVPGGGDVSGGPYTVAASAQGDKRPANGANAS